MNVLEIALVIALLALNLLLAIALATSRKEVRNHKQLEKLLEEQVHSWEKTANQERKVGRALEKGLKSAGSMIDIQKKLIEVQKSQISVLKTMEKDYVKQ